ncbi:MAG: hypothetical protein IPM03_08315 [Sulfuritalea sp.]|nr:hypothetical protein [Sulfuritalea sp.]
MPFIPLQQERRPAPDFPRVTPEVQADRDAEAEQIVAREFDQDMPAENRTALEKEYRQRFGGPSPGRGFVPLAEAGQDGQRGFIPLESERPSVLRNVLLNNPATAIVETGANLLSQGVALPAAGLAGIGAAAGKALGLTAAEPADVVHKVGGALTYQPRGEMGQAATAAVMAPFEALAKVGAAAGDKVLDATGSPVAATVVDTAINALPMAIAPGVKGAKAVREKFRAPTEEVAPVGHVAVSEPRGFLPPASTDVAPRGFIPLDQPTVMLDPIGSIPALDPAAGPLSRVALNAQAVAAESRVAAQEAILARGEEHGARMGSEGDVRRLETDSRSVGEPAQQGLPELRRKGPYDVSGVAGELQGVSAGRGTETGAGPVAVAGLNRPVEGIRAGERGLDEAPAPNFAPALLPPDQLGREIIDHPGSRATDRLAADYVARPTAEAGDGVAARDMPGPVALLDELEIPDPRRADLERAGMGEAAERETANSARQVTPGIAAGTGAEVGRPEKVGFVPLRDTVDAAAQKAATSPLNDKPQPTAAQIEAGVYAKGHLNLHGLDIAIENPAGSIRRGTDASGRAWETEMQQHYGYIKRSTAKDGDHVDVFVGERPESTRAFVVDQVDPKTGKYDEAKVILGAVDEADARRIYLDNYEPGWNGLGAITRMEMDAFRGWIKTGDTKKPVALDRAGKRAEPDTVEAPPVTLTLNDIPPSLLKKVKVSVEQIVGDEVTSVKVSAREALADLKEEIGVYEKLLADVGDGSKTLADSMSRRDKELKGFDSESVIEAAKDYQARGLPDGEASILAVQDHLRDLSIQRQGVVDAAIAEFQKRDPEKYAERLKKAAAVPQKAAGSSSDPVRARFGETKRAPAGRSAREPAEPPATLFGRPVEQMTNTQLANWGRSKALSEGARAKVHAEIERRAASADFSPEAAATPKELNSWAPGANYVPLVDEYKPATSTAATVADLPAPKRRENIIKRFASEIGTTVYEGRVKGEKRLGFFRPKVEEVRTKRANDIEVAAHEIAHLIDHRVPELQAAWKADKALAAELKSVSYDLKNVREGFAEGVRLFLTQPETLEARAPKVSAWLNAFADSHQYGPALRRAQADMTAWFAQDALNRARSKIGTETPLAEYLDGFWDKFRQSTVDDLHGIYQMERDLTGKINPNGPYESARLSRASASIADGAVRFGYPVKQADGSFKFAGKGLEEIMRPVSKNIDDALLYFVGKSANELIGQGREHLFTKGEVDAMLRLRTPEREKAFAEYQEWNKGVLDFAEAQGIVNPEARSLWQRTQYLPFHRVDQPGGLKGKPGDWAGVQVLTGGTTNIKDVLGNMIGNAAMLIDKSVKNEARRKIANLSQKEGGGRFMVKIDAESRPVKISGDQVLAELLKRYGIAIDGDVPAFFEFLIKGQPPAGNNVVAVMQGGKPVWFEVGDPIAYRALKAIDRPIMSEVVKWLGLPKRIGQATITATPDFWMANIARDTLMGSVMSRAGFVPILDSLKGMRERMTSDPLYRDYLANGGGLSSIFLDEQHLRTKLERYYRDQGIDYRTVLDTPDKLLTFIETLGDAFEMSTRLGEYRRAIERGENPRHAAYLGRDVSTDFAMRGDSKALGFMFDTVMFLKPAVVSWDRLYRGLAHDENKGAIAAKAGTMALMSAGLYLLNREDPRYKDLPDWDRDSNWHFFVGDQHFRWPKIWEIGALSSAAERSVEKIMDTDPQGLGKDFARILGATFNLNLMPQILAPLYEQAANRNSFTKAPIETPGMENVQPFLRSKPGTSETMKAAGMATRNMPEVAQINPARAEALLRGYFNTYAMYGLMLTDQALFSDKLAEKRADELPVVRRFYSQEPARHTRYESEFYDLLTEAKRLRGTMKELDEMGLRSFADAKEQSPLATEAKPLEHAAKSLGAINNEMEQVRRSDATPAEKRQKLDALTVERNALLKGAVTDSKGAQKARAP